VHAVHLIAAGTREIELASRIEQRAIDVDQAVPTGSTVASEAVAECTRIASARRLAQLAAPVAPARAVVTRRRKRRPGDTWFAAFRIAWLDDARCQLWEWLAAVAGSTRLEERDARGLIDT